LRGCELVSLGTVGEHCDAITACSIVKKLPVVVAPARDRIERQCHAARIDRRSAVPLRDRNQEV
ncbi:MAG TPA: hypothetical protein VK595_09030, partial [Vicinamibacterales bacterium]|nr:hypothetical protein [Vicinamibacterales bacterium]